MSCGRNKCPPLRLYMLKGSFLTADDGAKSAMNAKVWSRLPEELIWEVLNFVPAPAHFRLQSVNRKWRQVLTSSNFRNTVSMARLSSRQSEEQHAERVVGWVANGYGYGHGDSSGRHSNCKLKVVDIDLSSFVPNSFWKFGYYSVVAAADGLLCIADVIADVNQPFEFLDTPQFCVLNPLTRTCKVLPRVPFCPRECLPPTPTAVAMFGYSWDKRLRQWELLLATYDLAAAASCSSDSNGGWDWAAWDQLFPEDFDGEVAVAMCGGETFVFHDARLHVLACRPGGKLVEVAALDQPSTSPGVLDHYRDAKLVTHRGAVFLMAVNGLSDVMAWRLARDGKRLQWERLQWELQDRLTALICRPPGPVENGCTEYRVCELDVYRVRDFVYCTLMCRREYFRPRCLILGLNLDTGAWEVVHDDAYEEPPAVNWAKFRNGLELRPDLFLSRD